MAGTREAWLTRDRFEYFGHGRRKGRPPLLGPRLVGRALIWRPFAAISQRLRQHVGQMGASVKGVTFVLNLTGIIVSLSLSGVFVWAVVGSVQEHGIFGLLPWLIVVKFFELLSWIFDLGMTPLTQRH
jgi:hypothetical protein